MKLLLAAIAAAHGSEKAALFLLEQVEGTDYGKLSNTYHARLRASFSIITAICRSGSKNCSWQACRMSGS